MKPNRKSKGSITFKQLQSTIRPVIKHLEKLSDLADIENEIPCFSFSTDGKKAKITLFSPNIENSHRIDFWKEVDEIGADGGGNYHPLEMEFWIKTFREAADKLERDLKDCRSKPDEWRVVDGYCY